MKKIILTITVFMLILSCKTETKTIEPKVVGDFTFTSKEINSELPFEIEYTGEGKIDEAFYVLLKHSKSYPMDIDFLDNNARINIPDSVAAVALHFKVDGDYDNKEYIFNVVNKDNIVKLDTEASKQYYVLGNGSQYGLKTTEENVLNAIESALSKDPLLQDEWMSLQLRLTQRANKDEAKKLANEYLSKITSKKTLEEKDYQNLETLYKIKENKIAADSIINIGIERFPNGLLARNKIMNGFFDLKEFSEKEAYFNEHKEQLMQSNYADYIVENLAREHYNAGNESEFNSYLKISKNKASAARLLNSLAWPMAEKGENIEKALSLSKESLELITKEQKELNDKPEYYSKNQYKKSLDYSVNMYKDTYALLLSKSGNLKEAIKYQEQAIGEGKNPGMNERYIDYLVKDSQIKKAFSKASDFIKDGQSTVKLKDYFLKAFNELNKEGEANKALKKLEKEAYDNYLAELKKKMLDEEAPAFTIKNLAGENISLASLKGKTVVLDFWATWCGPCIASFPGMQKVIDKYKNNDNVEFLFIDTFEDGDDRLDKVSNFINDNNYNFNVLIDPVKEGSSEHTVAKAYGISGIPTKVIIGPNGKLNFKSVGFGGSDEKLLMEIDAMVDLLTP